MANALQSTLGKFTASVYALGALRDGFLGVIKSLDTLANATGRLSLVTRTTSELITAQKELLKIANEARVEYSSSVDLYARLARSLKDLNPSQQKMLQATQAINKSLIISGASAASAQAALIQLGQGLAANALRGEELNSVLEQTPRLAEAIAKGMGVGLADLRKIAETGKLTAQSVFEAILSQKDILEKEFAQMPKTVSQSMVVLKNNITANLDKFNQIVPVTKAISSSLLFLGEHFGTISKFIMTLGGAFVGYKAKVILAKVANMNLTGSFVHLTTSLKTSQAALLLNNQHLTNSTKALGLLNIGLKATKALFLSIAPTAAFALITTTFLNWEKLTATTASNIKKIRSLELDERIRQSKELINELETLKSKDQTTGFWGYAGQGWTGLDEKNLLRAKNTLKWALKSKENFAKKNDEVTKQIIASNDEAIEKADAFLKSLNFTPLQKEIQQTKDQFDKLRDSIIGNRDFSELNDKEMAKIDELYLAKLKAIQKVTDEFNAKALKEQKLSRENELKAHAAALKDKEQKYLKYYELIGDKTKAWAIKEKQIISEMKGFRVKEIQTAIAIQKKQFFEVKEVAKKSFDEIKTTWDNVTSSMSQSFEDNFFDVLTGKFKDFKSFLKDFGKDMFKSFTNPYARDLSKSLAGGLSGLLGFSGGNLKEQMTKAGLNLVDGQWIQGKDAKESEIIVSSAGKIIKGESVIEAMPGGDKLMQSISSLSTAASALNFLKDPSSVFSSASNFLTNPIKGITGNIANTGANLYGAGFHGAGMALTGVGDGAMSFFTGTGGNLSYQIGGTAYQTGAVLGGALAGAAVGGIGGMLGDKLFGADTYASTTGAIGGLIGGGLSAMGAFGAASGPVGWIITGVATVLGGLFGKWKVKDAGLEALKDIDFSFGTKDIQEYIYKKKKSWFSSKSKSDYTELTKQKIAEIRNIFSLTDSMLEEINANVLVVKKGRYSGKDFFDVGVVKGTIQSIMQIPETIQTEARKINTKYLYLDAKFQDELGDLSQTFTQDIPNPRLDEIYNAWKDYAKSIDKTTYEALNESLNQMIQARRSFKAWTLKDDAVGLAQFQQTTALKDAEAIAKSLGISFAELTAENFLKRYDEAVKTSFDPDTLNKWNALSNAMIKHSEATTNYTNTLLATATQLANQKISIANALGVDSYNLQREMLLREAQALGEKTGYTAVDGNLKIVASKYNVSSEAFRDWTNRLDKKTEELGRDKKATYDYVAKLTQIVELDRARAKQNANTSNFTYNTSYISHAKLFTDALDVLIKNTREASSNLKSVYDTSSNMLRKINSDNQDYIKEQYNKHLKTSKQLNTKLRANFDVKTSEEFAKSVNELSKYTDAYLKKENYNNELDYRFAKAVTSNNFKEFKDTSNRHESLKLIVEKLERLRDEATTQTQINEATATGINELKDLFEGFLNGKYKVGA